MDIDRPESFLTRKDRLYLLHETLPDTRQAKYERRKGARNRIKNGLLDLPAVRFLPPDERRKLFEDMAEGDDLYWALKSGVCIAKYACDDAGIPFDDFLEEAIKLGSQAPRPDIGDTTTDHKPPEAESFVETGRGKMLSDVSVEIEYEYTDTYFSERLRERLLEGGELDDDELVMLMRSEHFDQEVFDELRKRRSERRDPN